MADRLSILTIPGSLREKSFNRRLARAARELAPREAVLDIFELHEIPLYNQDLDDDERRPAPVRELKARITPSDAVLLVSPEYNHGVPGVLKNAVDWASRPGFASPMAGKPCGIMGASGGLSGTMRGQQHLKLVLMGMGALVFPHAGVAVPRAGEKFDEGGALTHEPTRDFVAAYLRDFAAWVRRVRPGVEEERLS